MFKTVSTISAFILSLGLAGAAAAAEEQQGGQQPSAAQQSEQNAQGGQTGAQGANAQLEAAMRKCEQGPAAEKQKCIDDAKKKHGQM
jgi:hypothetical protein